MAGRIKMKGGAILYVLKHACDAFEGLTIAIRFGGDVDSLASVCCGILSARFGLDSLPPFMLEAVENRGYLEQVGKQIMRCYSI